MRLKSLIALILFTGLILQAAILASPLLTPESTPEPAVLSRNTADQPLNIEAFHGCGGDIVPVQNENFEYEIVALVNAERAKLGLPPLKRNTDLDEIARYHAADLALDNYFDHDSFDREDDELSFTCYWNERISPHYTECDRLGENIAAGSNTPAGTMNLWMNSSGHRANILSTQFWEIGVGYYAGSGNYYRYWVQDFGRPTGRYPLLIESDAYSTENQLVNLYVYGDPDKWSQIRLNNDGGDWSAWMPFQNEITWTLPVSQGEHTVNAELRSGDKTTSTSDSIYFAGGEPFIPTDYIYIPLVVRSES